MMILSTLAEKTQAEDEVLVHWKTGTLRGGVISVETDRSYSDPLLIAELCVIRHLLLRQQVFNRLPMSGKGMALHVSSGAIRKLKLGTSKKREAYPFARFLSPRFDEITIKPHRWSVEDFPLSRNAENKSSLR